MEKNCNGNYTQTNRTLLMGYDEGDMRIWRYRKDDASDKVDVYLGDLYEFVGDRTMCHVTVGGQRITSFEPDNQYTCFLRRKGNWDYAGNPFLDHPVVTIFFRGMRWTTTVTALALVLAVTIGYVRRWRMMRHLDLHAVYDRFNDRDYLLRRLPFIQSVCTALFMALWIQPLPQVQAQVVLTNQKVHYYLYNHLGSVAVMLCGDGVGPYSRAGASEWEVEQRYVYTPFGKEDHRMRECTDILFQPIHGFTGQIYEEVIPKTL